MNTSPNGLVDDGTSECLKVSEDEKTAASSARENNDPTQPLPEHWAMRRLLWRLADCARSIGAGLATFGMPRAHHLVLRSIANSFVYFRRLPPKEIISGVKCYIYRPYNLMKAKLPVIVYYHGGGWFSGNTKGYHPFLSSICRETGAIIVSVEYRLAPEHPYPALVDDCVDVTRAVLNGDKNPDAIGSLQGVIDVNRVVAAGDSAGGNLCAAVALEMIRLGQLPRLKGVLLICPITQAITADHPSAAKFAPVYSKSAYGFIVSLYAGVVPTRKIRKAIEKGQHVPPELRRHYWKYIMPSDIIEVPPPEPMRQSPPLPAAISDDLNKIGKLVTTVRAWALLAEDEELAQMPPTLIQTCSNDAFLDENIVFYERIWRSGAVDVRRCHMERSEHCETILHRMIPSLSSKASRDGHLAVVEFLKELLYDDKGEPKESIQEQGEQ